MKTLEKLMTRVLLLLLVMSSVAAPIKALADDSGSSGEVAETSLVSEATTNQEDSTPDTLSDQAQTDSDAATAADDSTSASAEAPAADAQASPASESVSATTNSNPAVTSSAQDQASTASAVSSAPSGQSRAAAGNVVSDILTGMSMTSIDGTNLATTPLIQWQTFQINANFALPNNQIAAGDTATIQMPTSLAPTSSDFPVLDSLGNQVATAHVDGTTKTVTLTFTDYVENHYDITGSLRFFVRVDHSVVPGAETLPLNFTVENRTYYAGQVTFEGIGPTGQQAAQPLSKASWVEDSDPQTVQYNLAVNRSGQALPQARLSDTIAYTSGQVVPDTLSITSGSWSWANDTGTWHLNNATDVTATYPVTYASDYRSFEINLGDIPAGLGFWVSYQVHLAEMPTNGDTYVNTATLTSQGDPVSTYTNTTYSQLASGQAQGYSYRLALTKQAPDGSLLAGATFRLTRTSDQQVLGDYTTDADGQLTVTGLEKTAYSLREITAPAGYQLLSQPINIAASDFSDTTQTASLTVVNQPETLTSQETISLSGRKTWQDANNQDGLRPTSITIRLYADGQEVAVRQVSASDNWSYRFDNLPKTRDGRDIVYTISEDAVSGYSSQITGLDVTNSHTPATTTLRVTKVWEDGGNADGKRPGSITIRLYANGQLVRTAQMGQQAGNRWVYDFSDLPVYANGQAIVYTISEDPVPGYTTSIDGLTITNRQSNQARLPLTGEGWSIGLALLGICLIFMGLGLVAKEGDHKPEEDLL